MFMTSHMANVAAVRAQLSNNLVLYQYFMLTVSHMAKYHFGKWLSMNNLTSTRMATPSNIKARRLNVRRG
jgi:hypothetical protein